MPDTPRDFDLVVYGATGYVGALTEAHLAAHAPPEVELARATEQEKQSQLDRLDDFHARHVTEAAAALRRLQDVATGGGNVFDELMRAARVCSLGQLTEAFFAFARSTGTPIPYPAARAAG